MIEDNIKLPHHIAVIMDGNGRWAQKRLLPRKAGHGVGCETFKRDAEYLNSIGVKYMTVFAFSTENWNRPQDEIDEILRLLKKYLLDACNDLIEKNVRLRFIGNIKALPKDIYELMLQLHKLSELTTGIQVNVAFNYGGRSDIVNAFKKLAASGIDPSEITEKDISENLFTSGIPDPDLLIRTGAEMRISNFLLWQTAYTELYFSNVLWPDFDENELDKAIRWYSSRDRRFGGLINK